MSALFSNQIFFRIKFLFRIKLKLKCKSGSLAQRSKKEYFSSLFFPDSSFLRNSSSISENESREVSKPPIDEKNVSCP